MSIARAIYSKRPILILDEPTSGLDKEFENYLVNSLSELRENRLIIISTHSINLMKIKVKIFIYDKL